MITKREIQEQIYGLEAEFQNFERKGSNMKKLFNGKIERMRIQINKIVDQLKEQTNKLIDQSITATKKQVAIKVEKTKDSLSQFKPVNISKIYNDQLKRLINLVLHTDYPLENDAIKNFLQNLQQQQMELAEQCKELIEQCQESVEAYTQDTLSTASDAFVTKKLVTLRYSLKLQMEQHLAAKNCTHKGFHKVEPVKAYYGYYYHISGYAIRGELPAKSKKLAEKIDQVVNDLYKLQFRDSTIDDCVQAYFIY